MATRPSQALLALALVVTALVVQLTVLSRLPLPGATPDLLLVVVVGLALVHGPQFGAVTGFAAGLALDLAPPADAAAGHWAFTLCLVGYLVGLAEVDDETSLLVPLAAVVLAAAGSVALYAGLGALFGDQRVTVGDFLGVLPTAVGYDLVLAPFALPLVFRLARPEPVWR